MIFDLPLVVAVLFPRLFCWTPVEEPRTRTFQIEDPTSTSCCPDRSSQQDEDPEDSNRLREDLSHVLEAHPTVSSWTFEDPKLVPVFEREARVNYSQKSSVQSSAKDMSE